MTDTHSGLGHNQPPISDILAITYSPDRLAAEHDALAARVDDFSKRARLLATVADEDSNKLAGELVVEARALASEIDKTKDEVKAPILAADRNIMSFFAGLNNSDTKRPGVVTSHKIRLEREIRDHGFRVAAAARETARLAAEAQRIEAARIAEAARVAEEANKPKVSEVLLDQGVRAEAKAEAIAAVATGPVQDVARTRTGSSVTGLRAVPGFEIVDRAALKATLGPLCDSFTMDAVMAAIRKFRIDEEKIERWAFRDDDQDAQKRIVIAKPNLPGVEFFTEYQGSVRA